MTDVQRYAAVSSAPDDRLKTLVSYEFAFLMIFVQPHCLVTFLVKHQHMVLMVDFISPFTTVKGGIFTPFSSKTKKPSGSGQSNRHWMKR